MAFKPDAFACLSCFYGKSHNGMKRLLISIVCIISVITGFSQSADGRYVSRMTRDGTLFFVNPHKLKDLTGIRSFEYDMTMLSWTDSVTVNFTIESDRMTVPSAVGIESGNKYYECNNYSPLYIDIKKNHYEIRITSKFPCRDIETIIDTATPPSFMIKQDGVDEKASYSPKGWKKDSKKLSDIYKLYLYSK